MASFCENNRRLHEGGGFGSSHTICVKFGPSERQGQDILGRESSLNVDAQVGKYVAHTCKVKEISWMEEVKEE